MEYNSSFSLFPMRRFVAFSIKIYLISFFVCQVISVIYMALDSSFNSQILEKYAMGLLLQLVGFLLMSALCESVVYASRKRIIMVGAQPSKIAEINFSPLVIVICLVALIVAIVYFTKTDNALLQIMFGSSDTIQVRMDNHVDQFGRVFGYSQRFLFPLIFLIGAFVLSFDSFLKNRVLAFFMIFLALLYNSWASDKTPVAMLLVMYSLMRLFEIDRVTLNSLFKFVLWPFFAALFVVFFIFYFKPAWSKGPKYLSEFIIKRITYNPSLNTYEAFLAFEECPKTYFFDIYPLSLFVDDKPQPLSRMIADRRGDHIGKAPPTTVGHFYAQIGILGCLFSGFICALLIYCTAIILRLSRLEPMLFYPCAGIFFFAVTRMHWASLWNVASAEIFTIWALSFLGLFCKKVSNIRMSLK